MFANTFHILIISTFYIICTRNISAAPGSMHSPDSHRTKSHAFARFPSRTGSQYSRIKLDPVNEFLVDDDDLFELSKRQNSDDYGHLRFGKRGEETFDDYGHLRFGRNGNDS